MRKNELVHLHALLVQVAETYVDHGVIERDALEPYRALGVTPMALREPRDAHEEAVRTLAGLLAAATDPQEPTQARPHDTLPV